MNLFLDKEIVKESAFCARLSDKPENWPQELSSELYKQLPYLSDYEVNVSLEKVDPEKGVGYGYADVRGKTARPVDEHESHGIPAVRIPLVVVDKAVKPFSVFMDGKKTMPLSEERLREALFDPTTFDISNVPPRIPSLVDNFTPPYRYGVGWGGGQFKEAADQQASQDQSSQKQPPPEDKGAGKAGPNPFAHISQPQWEALYKNPKVQKNLQKYGPQSVEVANSVYEIASKLYGGFPKSASLLKDIAPRIRESDAKAFVEKVASDADLQAGFKRAGVVPTLIQVFDRTKRASADDYLGDVAKSIMPSVMTFQKLSGGNFLVKMANNDAFVDGQQAQGAVVPGPQVAQDIGEDNAAQMQPGDTATATADPVADTTPVVGGNPKAKVVEEFGQYKVQDMMGNSLIGHVFPTTLAWDGQFTPTPAPLFTNGSTYAVQDAVAGELVGKGTNLPSDVPRGDGVFYYTEGGDAIATAPITVHGSAAGPDGLAKLQVTDLWGHQFQISQMQGLKLPERVSDAEYALPDTWKFMRLNNQTQLIPDPTQMNKSASVHGDSSNVTLMFNGSYSLKGGCGLSKVAHSNRECIDSAHAEFMLGVLGVDGKEAKQLVKEAKKKGSVKLGGLKTITTLAERYAGSVKMASAILSRLPTGLKRDLIKEAALIEDGDTVDKVLALNFVNPENLTTFLRYIPELEIAGEKLAEMLLASYLGLKEIPEESTERAMRNLEDVVVQLKAIHHTDAQA